MSRCGAGCQPAPHWLSRIPRHREVRKVSPGPAPFCWLFMRNERKTMAKKSSVSSQPGRLKSMRSEDIRNRHWTERERQGLRRISVRQVAWDDSHINVEDIPCLTDEQLASMVRLRD